MELETKPVYTDDAVAVASNGPISNNAMISIGGIAIPFVEADIHLRMGEFITIELVARAKDLDIKALQQHTRVMVVEPEAAS